MKKSILPILLVLAVCWTPLACNKKFTATQPSLGPVLIATPTCTQPVSNVSPSLTWPVSVTSTATWPVTATFPPALTPTISPTQPVSWFTPTLTLPVTNASPTVTWPVSWISPTVTQAVSNLSPTATYAVTNTSPTMTIPVTWLSPTTTATWPVSFGPYNTPTPHPTPGCGFTPVAGASVSLGSLGPYTPANPSDAPFAVIRSLADWDAYFGPSNSVSAPVDFDDQMVILVGNNFPCAYSTLKVTEVCETSDGVFVSLANYTPQIHCNVATMWFAVTGAAVAGNNLPVCWSVTEVSGLPPP